MCIVTNTHWFGFVYSHFGYHLGYVFYVFAIVFGTSCIFFYFVLGMLHFCIAVCFISSLYFDLCVTGDDASIRLGILHANQTYMCLDPHQN